jgi:hypothetical protein
MGHGLSENARSWLGCSYFLLNTFGSDILLITCFQRWIVYAITNRRADWDVAIVNHPLIHRFI